MAEAEFLTDLGEIPVIAKVGVEGRRTKRCGRPVKIETVILSVARISGERDKIEISETLTKLRRSAIKRVVGVLYAIRPN